MKPSVALLLIVAAALVMGACGGEAGAATSTEQTITIRYSRFDSESITVPAKPVTITLRNDDPIDHEWMIGDAAMHERHRTGTEPYHDTRASEVTVPALSSRVTTLTFDEPGEFLYICHLPGHEAYGMVGTLRVVDG